MPRNRTPKKKLFDLKDQDLVAIQRDDIDTQQKRLVLQLLVHGRPVRGVKEQDECSLCGLKLGSMILGAHGFEWPQGATHYVHAHNLWPPEIDEFLAAWAKETGGNVSGL